MNAVHSRIGSFVRVRGGLNQLGVGKLVEFDGRFSTVEFFHSIVHRQRESVEISQVVFQQCLAPQTRCYVPGDDGRWRMGRLGRKVSEEYEVFFREGEARFLHERAIFVRSATPIEDPLETLIFQGHETPYFHDRRFSFVSSLVRQRAACRGMSGLISSRIRLLPHQVEVVRRVLEDPIQRYLLADEVGLGKTIEAGIVLRQFLLDDASGKAVVVVPALLVDQWIEELEDKFQISRFGEDRVAVIRSDEVERLVADERWGMAVIDEAQHVASAAYSNSARERSIFDSFRRLCSMSERLLLLSATPVLNNERDFLAMLHLLDPQVYGLDEVEAFETRVRHRQEIGQILLSLQEGSPGFLLRSSLQRLREHFSSDQTLGQLCNSLDRAIGASAPDPTARDRAIRSIRVHMSETYRLHRRMLRNRRGHVQIESLSGRVSAQQPTPRTLEYDIDERSPRIHDLLEEWRDTASASLNGRGETDEDTLLQSRLESVFAILFQAAGTWFDMLRAVVDARLYPGDGCADAIDYDGESFRSLRDTPLFPGEREILDGILRVLRAPSESGDRLELVELSLGNLRRSNRNSVPPKCVVFTRFTRVCRELLLRLRTAFGEQAVVGYHTGLACEEVQAALTRFRTQRDCFILICDRAGEEGRNLQFADRVVHFDMPISPNHVEQRIGRLDRIGRDRPVRSTIMVGPECEHSLFEAWYRLLDEGFQVFDTSIASLQFLVNARLPTLLHSFFSVGASGVIDAIPHVRNGVAEEKKKLGEQDALDAIDAFEQDAVACFESIQSLEAAHDELEAALHGWVGDALRFSLDRDLHRVEGTIHYEPRFDRFGGLSTLVPGDWIQQILSREMEQPGTFNRDIALQIPGTPLFRVGEGFVNAMAKYVRWDDRGQAFAFWRVSRGWDPSEGAEWTGFRFNYEVSAELKDARKIIADLGFPTSAARQLLRRADSLFPPHMEVVFLDTDGRSVDDGPLLEILHRPYLAYRKGGNDFNLANERLSSLHEIIPQGEWESVCRLSREHSRKEVLNRGIPSLRDRCEALALQAERELGARFSQLSLRVDRERRDGQPNQSAITERELAAVESINIALIRGIRDPHLRLDSVGFLVVSGRAPASGVQR